MKCPICKQEVEEIKKFKSKTTLGPIFKACDKCWEKLMKNDLETSKSIKGKRK